MSPAREAIMRLIRTADLRNYSSSYKEALRTALVAVEAAEGQAIAPKPHRAPVIYKQRLGAYVPPPRWDTEVESL